MIIAIKTQKQKRWLASALLTELTKQKTLSLGGSTALMFDRLSPSLIIDKTTLGSMRPSPSHLAALKFLAPSLGGVAPSTTVGRLIHIYNESEMAAATYATQSDAASLRKPSEQEGEFKSPINDPSGAIKTGSDQGSVDDFRRREKGLGSSRLNAGDTYYTLPPDMKKYMEGETPIPGNVWSLSSTLQANFGNEMNQTALSTVLTELWGVSYKALKQAMDVRFVGPSTTLPFHPLDVPNLKFFTHDIFWSLSNLTGLDEELLANDASAFFAKGADLNGSSNGSSTLNDLLMPIVWTLSNLYTLNSPNWGKQLIKYTSTRTPGAFTKDNIVLMIESRKALAAMTIALELSPYIALLQHEIGGYIKSGLLQSIMDTAYVDTGFTPMDTFTKFMNLKLTTGASEVTNMFGQCVGVDVNGSVKPVYEVSDQSLVDKPWESGTGPVVLERISGLYDTVKTLMQTGSLIEAYEQGLTMTGSGQNQTHYYSVSPLKTGVTTCQGGRVSMDSYSSIQEWHEHFALGYDVNEARAFNSLLIVGGSGIQKVVQPDEGGAPDESSPIETMSDDVTYPTLLPATIDTTYMAQERAAWSAIIFGTDKVKLEGAKVRAANAPIISYDSEVVSQGLISMGYQDVMGHTPLGDAWYPVTDVRTMTPGQAVKVDYNAIRILKGTTIQVSTIPARFPAEPETGNPIPVKGSYLSLALNVKESQLIDLAGTGNPVIDKFVSKEEGVAQLRSLFLARNPFHDEAQAKIYMVPTDYDDRDIRLVDVGIAAGTNTNIVSMSNHSKLSRIAMPSLSIILSFTAGTELMKGVYPKFL